MQQKQPNSAKKILSIDDDRATSALICATLRKHYFDVHIANDGNEGIARAFEIEPALILLDVFMPGINGFQVLEILKESSKTAHTPVLMLTAMNNDQLGEEALRRGAIGVHAKPIAPFRLLKHVRKILDSPAAMEKNDPGTSVIADIFKLSAMKMNAEIGQLLTDQNVEQLLPKITEFKSQSYKAGLTKIYQKITSLEQKISASQWPESTQLYEQIISEIDQMG